MSNSSLIHNRNYKLLILANFISYFGDKVNDITLMWYVYTYMDSPVLAALSLVINFLPGIIFSPLAGVLADKYNRKNIMVICDSINGISALILAVAIYFNLNIYAIFVITFIMSSLDTLYSPSSMSIVPDIVEEDQLIKANSVNSTLSNSISILAPSIAGVLYAVISPYIIFLVNGISFFISAVIEKAMVYSNIEEDDDEEEEEDEEEKGFIAEYADGFKLIFKDNFLFFNAIIGGGMINFLLAPMSVYIPVFISDNAGSSSISFGMLNSAMTIGSLAASLALISIGDKFNKFKIVSVGYLLEGLSVLLFGVSSSFISGFLSLILLGIALDIIGINMNTIVQEKIDSSIIGRCMSAIILIANVSVPMGYLFGGFIVEKVKLSHVLLVSGFIIMIFGLISFYVMKKKRLCDEVD